MNFTNINDPAGVTALLEKLRSSQAWAEIQNEPSQPELAAPRAPVKEETVAPTAQPDPLDTVKDDPITTANRDVTSVANLLSQLSSEVPSIGPAHSHPPQFYSSSTPPNVSTAMHKSLPKKDVRSFTFQQSLPYLAQLSEDPVFLDAVSKLRKDQETLERRLWEEREAICNRQSQKVNTAVTKANMLAMGISQREAEIMKQAFEKELRKFDQEQVLPAWDDLITKQQIALEKLGVPALFVTDSASDKVKQYRIVSVIEGITGSGES